MAIAVLDAVSRSPAEKMECHLMGSINLVERLSDEDARCWVINTADLLGSGSVYESITM